MQSSGNRTLRLFSSIQSKYRKTIIRTLINPFGSKQIERAKDSHSNTLTDSEHVFEVQHHTVNPRSMVNIKKKQKSITTLEI